MRRLIVVLLCLGIIFAVDSTVKAKEKDFELEKEYALSYLELNGFSVNNISKPIELFNINSELEAVCFTLNEDGYIIVNTNDLEIPEFSFVSGKPFNNDSNMNMYNGPMEYYIKGDNGKFYEAKSNRLVDINKLTIKYKNKSIDKLEKFEELWKTAESSIMRETSSFIENGNIPGTLPTWSSSYYCGIDACAITLKYYDLTHAGTWLPAGYNTNGTAQDYLLSNLYIENAGTVGYNLVYGDGLFTGLRDYLNDQNITNYEAYTQSYSLGDIHKYIDLGYPVITGTTADHPDSNYQSHWIITHGYLTGYDGVAYLIINDGFGSNDIYVTGNYMYYDELVYIRN